jgi:hypothetical protein
MRRRTLTCEAAFGHTWKHLPGLIQQFLGCFEDNNQYFNQNFTHSLISPRFDKAGFVGAQDFTGAGRSFVTMRLEVPSSTTDRFSIAVHFSTNNH